MVFFNCDACGESLKKNQVEKHTFRCHSCYVLSCVDCGKEFRGEDYQQHTTCISENQKYGGKDYKPKPSENKGQRKQDEWFQQVQDAIDKTKTNKKLSAVLEKLKDYPNLPRKKAKFQNFLQNSLRVYPAVAGEVWEALSSSLQCQQQANKPESEKTNQGPEKSGCSQSEARSSEGEASESSKQNGHSSQETSEKKLSKRQKKEERKKKANKTEKKDKRQSSHDEEQPEPKMKKKRKHQEMEEEVDEGKRGKKKKRKQREITEDEEEESTEPERKKGKKEDGSSQDSSVLEEESSADDEEEEEEEEEEAAPVEKFKWEETIIAVLSQASDKELSIKKLRKKVLAECYARGGDGKNRTEEKMLATFKKKIHKNPCLKVLKDRVKLKN